MSAGFIVLPFAGTGVVNGAGLPCCFYNICLKMGFSDQTLNGKTKAFVYFVLYIVTDLCMWVYLFTEAAETQKIFAVDLCKHSV